MVGLTVT